MAANTLGWRPVVAGLLLLILVPESEGQSGILYPRESESRQVKSLDGVWEFRASNDSTQGFKEKWFSDRLYKWGSTIRMPVPSSYNDITEDRSLREHVGVVWYERNFFVPSSWKEGKLRVWLRFGSVHYLAHVWINGQPVLFHEIGHLPFQAEISNALNYGAENRITLAVDNTLSATTVPQGSLDQIHTLKGTKTIQRYTFDFFNYAGIHRSVHLYTTPRLYIEDITVYTDILGTKGIVYFNVSYGGLEVKANVNCKVNLIDGDGKPVARVSKEGIEPSGYFGKLDVPFAKLWWPYLMNPSPGYLYTLEVRIVTEHWGAEVEDIYRLPVGIRTIHWTNSSLLINGKPVYLRGFGRHEDSDIRGKGLDLALVTKDYNLLKWIGANAYRTSHYPYAEEIMDFADQQGIMIIDECPSVDADKFSPGLLKKHKDSLTELIQRDKNRPSVVMWSVANEPRTQYPAAADYFRSVVEHVKTLESKRPVTAVLNQWYSVDHALYRLPRSVVNHVKNLDYRPVTSAIAQAPGYEYAGQFMDIIGFNRYNGWYSDPGKTEVIQLNVESEAEQWHLKHNKPVIMMEYGADTMEGLHLLPEFIWSEEYQVKLLSEHFKAFDNLRNRSFFIGELIWNFADFKTDQSTTRVGGNKKGIFTRNRQPKAAAYHVRKRYWQLAEELDGAESPGDMELYTASVMTPLNNRIEL